ncbi:MFS transporter [Duganella sp. BJB488]|uniref:MFS transporter n=1 Tax=unclassified Duganella TaxID=2636909 RepID=UPI000E356F18|nr:MULTISPECIES: MFS transporter [unclassified Duganella]NVD73189.1 MFS transporter [Duganella sp. BJB1802]RFP09731.1 MFS transporter [Duganella sp. BJB489]RFP13407.1 MFS transporter [Duganella sp. BJB488]RFP29300.1 MFS transporter [Duganella sp. BJB480]
MSDSTAPSSNGFGVLRHRNFSLYLTARTLATLAVQMQNVAIGWQVYALTHNLFDLGLIGLAQFAPFLLLILIAGHAADRYNRRLLIALAMGAQLLCGLALLAFTVVGLSAVWPVFAVLVLFGSARAFMGPATQAMLVNLVPPERFSQAVALSSSSFHVAVILGPTLGGLFYLAGPKTVYMISSALLLAAVILMCLVKSVKQPSNREPATWHTVLEGLRFVWSKPVVLGAISLDLFAVLFGGATALLPALAHDVLHIGPTGLGLLRTAPGAGAAVCSIALAFHPITRRVGAWMLGGVAVFGAGTLVLGATSTFLVALTALFVMGAGDMISVYVRHLLVQYETPDAIRGRVSAVNSVFIGASNELGEFESGLTAGWMGLTRAVLFGGAATLAVTGIWTVLFPVLSHMDRFPHEEKS